MKVYPEYDSLFYNSSKGETHWYSIMCDVRVLRDGKYYLFLVRVDTESNGKKRNTVEKNFASFIKAVHDVVCFGDPTVEINLGNGIKRGIKLDPDQTSEVDRLKAIKEA